MVWLALNGGTCVRRAFLSLAQRAVLTNRAVRPRAKQPIAILQSEALNPRSRCKDLFQKFPKFRRTTLPKTLESVHCWQDDDFQSQEQAPPSECSKENEALFPEILQWRGETFWKAEILPRPFLQIAEFFALQREKFPPLVRRKFHRLQ